MEFDRYSFNEFIRENFSFDGATPSTLRALTVSLSEPSEIYPIA